MGLLGNLMGSAFGSTMQTANMAVQAANVVINGVGGLTGGVAGAGSGAAGASSVALPGPSTSALPGAGALGAVGSVFGVGGDVRRRYAGLPEPETILRDVPLPYRTGPAAAGALPIEVRPSRLPRLDEFPSWLPQERRGSAYREISPQSYGSDGSFSALGPLRKGMLDVAETTREASDAMRSVTGAGADAANALLKVGQDVFSGAGGSGGVNRLFSLIPGGSSSGETVPAFADGTLSAPGGMALVGERGPELVNLPRGSQVVPNHALPPSSGGSSGYVDKSTRTYNIPPLANGVTPQDVVAAIEAYDKRLDRSLPKRMATATRRGFG